MSPRKSHNPKLQSSTRESRVHVRSVARFLNAARYVFRTQPRDASDEDLSESLRSHLDLVNVPWLPPTPPSGANQRPPKTQATIIRASVEPRKPY